MKHTITNGILTVTVESVGAELNSIKTADGTEYLWQPDPNIWGGQAPNIFPYVARLTDQTCVVDGKQYQMPTHGIVRAADLQTEHYSIGADGQGTCSSITFVLKDSTDTFTRYPFLFEYRITYTLDGNVLAVTNEVRNTGDRTMYFGIGGHPGFNVPMEEGIAFEDYYLEFGEACQPTRVGFTPACFVNGQNEQYPLENGTKLPLHHDLFDNDAVVLRNASRKVTIRSDKGTRAVEVSYPDYPLIGFWHKPKTEAPYVCVEPWSSLPSRDGIIENLAQQSDLINLKAGDTYRNRWEIRIIE